MNVTACSVARQDRERMQLAEINNRRTVAWATAEHARITSSALSEFPYKDVAMRIERYASLLLLIIAAPAISGAHINKCTLPDGSTEYSDGQ
jgi:hypothetical protein